MTDVYTDFKFICTDAGFKARGKTFFRVIGDGVLQVVKLRALERSMGQQISVGLFSMYGQLRPEWFTATGSITRYPIEQCVNHRSHALPPFFAPGQEQNVRMVVDGKIIPFATSKTQKTAFAPGIYAQVEMLRTDGIAWLDSIQDQKQLAKELCTLDKRWTDGLKFAPYLASGNISAARKVAKDLLAQDTRYEFWGVRDPDRPDYALLLQMLKREDPEEIKDYLMKNFERNAQRAQFCM